MQKPFHDLFQKYDVPGPRYTSYPTVPSWGNDPLEQNQWFQSLETSIEQKNSDGFGIYIHIPFCQKLCLYCGCHKIIRKNDSWNKRYIEALLSEWKMYKSQISHWPELIELHLGGGTPTFFSPEELKSLILPILEEISLSKNFDFSFEADPRVTSQEHLQVLFDLGFRRLSLGVQDFDPLVQKTISREQSFDQVRELTEFARKIGYKSINHDLIYGLPKQTPKSIQSTIQQIRQLKPDRIAFYSYAYVPQVAKQQRVFKLEDIPQGGDKRQLFELGRELLLAEGYDELGMDHFSLPTDDLSKAHREKTLHRNFMGYVPYHVNPLIGLGASSIGDSGSAYSQNEKDIKTYMDKIESKELPLFRGYQLSQKDRIIKERILELMTQFQLTYEDEFKNIEEFDSIKKNFKNFSEDGLLEFTENGFELTDIGKCFARNVAMSLDIRLPKKTSTPVFSRSI